ncbi:MAG: hypothetical protein AAGA54_37610 [Myxococcota bacterium]
MSLWVVACTSRVESGSRSAAASGESQTDTGAETSGVVCGDDGVMLGPIVVLTDADAQALEGCHTVDGDLFIGTRPECDAPDPAERVGCAGGPDLTSIEALAELRVVTGDVRLGFAEPCLEDEGRVLDPIRLASLSALSGLESVGGDLQLDAAGAVRGASFDGLVSVGGTLRVGRNIPAEPRFPNLETAQNVELCGRVHALLDTPRLRMITESVVVADTSMTSAEFLREVEDVTLVRFDENRLLTDLPWDAMPVGASVRLRENPEIEAVDGAGWAPRALVVVGSASCTRVSGAGLEQIGGIEMTGSPVREAGFEDLKVVDGSFTLDTTDLEDLSGFASLERVGDGQFFIINNPRLCQSEAEAFAARVESSGWVEVYGNADC